MNAVLDFTLDHPIITIGLLLAVLFGLLYLAHQAQEREIEAFRTECLANFSEAQCNILTATKRDAANARAAAAFATGVAIGTLAGRR